MDSRQGIIEHRDFELFCPWFLIDAYDRDGGHYEPRYWIEFVAPEPIAQMAADVRLGCVTCQTMISPFRLRKGDSLRGGPIGRLYFAVACPWEDGPYGRASLRCSRTKAARDEYERVINAVKALGGGRGIDPRQLSLF